MPPDIFIPKAEEDPLGFIKGSIEEIRTNQAGALQKLNDAIPSFEKKFTEYEARIAFLEDKANNPNQRYYQSPHATRQERNHAVSQWVQNAYRSTNSNWIQGESGVQWRANQEVSTDSKGGYLVPTPLYPEVLRIVQEFGVAREICRTLPMTRLELDITRKNAGPVMSWPEEGVAPSTTGATFGIVRLQCKLMMALDEITLQMNDDSAIDLASYLIDVFGEAVSEEEDKQAFNSTAPFTGLCQNTDVGIQRIASTAATFRGNLEYDDFVNLMSKPDKNVRARGMFLFSSDIFADILKIRDEQGRPLWNTALGDNAPATILGRPYRISHVMPGWDDDGINKPIAAYGDFRRYLLGDRRTMTIDFSQHAAWNTAAESMRVLERIAFACGIPAAFALLKSKES